MSTQMEKLLAAQEKTQEKLRRAQEEEKQLKKRIAELKRNERTHRLCTRGAPGKPDESQAEGCCRG